VSRQPTIVFDAHGAVAIGIERWVAEYLAGACNLDELRF